MYGRGGRTRIFTGAAAFLACLPLTATPAPAGMVGVDPAPDVSTARSEKDALDLLRRELPGSGGRLLLVSPHDYLGGLLLPLRREGALSDLAVVLPFDDALTSNQLDEARSFLENGGVSDEDRKSFLLDNGSIAGRIEGMPVMLSSAASLPRQGVERLVVLDASFLPAIYRNEVKTPMVELAWKLLVTLRNRKVTARRVILFDPVGRPGFPLEYGFVTRLLSEMVADPSRFAADLPDKWKVLKAAETAYFFAQYPDAMVLYKEYLGMVPGDASASYKIALMGSRDLDVEMTLQWLNRAADADPLYRRAFPEVAGALYRKELFDGAERILLAGLARFPRDLLMATNLSALYMTRGMGARESGDLESAREWFGMAASVEGAEPAMRARAEEMAKSIHLPGELSDGANPAPEGVTGYPASPAAPPPPPSQGTPVSPPAQPHQGQ